MLHVLQDAARAVRSLRRSPGFVVVSVLSLGLALGVTTTMFGLVDAALNPVIPLREPARIVTVNNAGDGAGHDVTWEQTSRALAPASDLFEELTIANRQYSFLRIGSHYDRQVVLAVPPEFLDVTGVSPFIGRGFAADGGDAITGDVALVSFSLWRVALGSVRDLRRATVEVEGRVYRIIGVLPPYLPVMLDAAVYVPLTGAAGTGYTSLVASLASGIDASHAQEQLRSVIDPLLERSYGVGRRPFRFYVNPVLQNRPEEMSDLQRILLASAFLVLIIACGNLANLMLARGLARERDFALHFALGARRANLIRQTLIEALICALAGAAVGVLIARWAFDLVMYRMTREVPGLGAMAAALNWRVFAFAVLAAVVTSLVFGLVPAIRTSSIDLNVPLKSGAGTTTTGARSRFSALVVVEVALTMTLMLGAGLLMKAVQEMRTSDIGYNPRGLLLIDAFLPRSITNRDRTVPHDEMWRLLDRVRAQPGVLGAALEGEGRTPKLGPALTSALAGGGNRHLYATGYTIVSPDYLRTLGVPVIQGRDFTRGDAAMGGGVIINETAARLLWPTDSAVGRMLKLGAMETDARWLPVVGIARDTRRLSTVMPVTDPVPELWVVPAPGDSVASFERMKVRVPAHREADVRTDLDRVARQALPPGTIVVVRPELEWFDNSRLARDFIARMFIVFGCIALGLSAVGLYCVLSFTVAERRRELAVRSALGATGMTCARMVVRDAALMVLAGTGAGAFLAMWLARALDSLLYSVFYTDAVVLVMAEGMLMIVAFVACLVPARRAARSDPMEILRAS